MVCSESIVNSPTLLSNWFRSGQKTVNIKDGSQFKIPCHISQTASARADGNFHAIWVLGDSIWLEGVKWVMNKSHKCFSFEYKHSFRIFFIICYFGPLSVTLSIIVINQLFLTTTHEQYNHGIFNIYVF